MNFEFFSFLVRKELLFFLFSLKLLHFLKIINIKYFKTLLFKENMKDFNKGNIIKGQTKMGKMKLDNDSNIETMF